MARRPHLPRDIAAQVPMLVRRRCCLCVFLKDHTDECRGQIAHLNRRNGDHRLSNLVWLCLDHHDQYDSRTSQSRGLSELEVCSWRDKLIAHYGEQPPFADDDRASHEMRDAGPATTAAAKWHRPWRFPLYQIADEPELFAFTSTSGHDGICEIERVHLPDGRIVIACVEALGNPGRSITNAVEEIATQVCARFGIAPDRLVWLEHYDEPDPDAWRLVTFGSHCGTNFENPDWTTMDDAHWRALGLSVQRPAPSSNRLASRLQKHFPWPPEEGLPLGIDND